MLWTLDFMIHEEEREGVLLGIDATTYSLMLNLLSLEKPKEKTYSQPI